MDQDYTDVNKGKVYTNWATLQEIYRMKKKIDETNQSKQQLIISRKSWQLMLQQPVGVQLWNFRTSWKRSSFKQTGILTGDYPDVTRLRLRPYSELYHIPKLPYWKMQVTALKIETVNSVISLNLNRWAAAVSLQKFIDKILMKLKDLCIQIQLFHIYILVNTISDSLSC